VKWNDADPAIGLLMRLPATPTPGAVAAGVDVAVVVTAAEAAVADEAKRNAEASSADDRVRDTAAAPPAPVPPVHAGTSHDATALDTTTPGPAMMPSYPVAAKMHTMVPASPPALLEGLLPPPPPLPKDHAPCRWATEPPPDGPDEAWTA
jgi:hypothetical protein